MKKSLVCLGIAVMSFSNVAVASNFDPAIEKMELLTVRGVTPLCTAISKGDVAAVRTFLQYGINVNERSNGLTPLMIAARYNNVEIIQLLLDHGADIKATNDDAFTALKIAELSKATDAVALLKSKMGK